MDHMPLIFQEVFEAEFKGRLFASLQNTRICTPAVIWLWQWNDTLLLMTVHNQHLLKKKESVWWVFSPFLYTQGGHFAKKGNFHERNRLEITKKATVYMFAPNFQEKCSSIFLCFFTLCCCSVQKQFLLQHPSHRASVQLWGQKMERLCPAAACRWRQGRGVTGAGISLKGGYWLPSNFSKVANN